MTHHGVTPNSSDICIMSGRKPPIEGTSPTAMVRRAQLVCELACELRDYDPRDVWDYLTCLPAVEIQRMLVIALAAVDVDKPLGELFAWVINDLGRAA